MNDQIIHLFTGGLLSLFLAFTAVGTLWAVRYPHSKRRLLDRWDAVNRITTMVLLLVFFSSIVAWVYFPVAVWWVLTVLVAVACGSVVLRLPDLDRDAGDGKIRRRKISSIFSGAMIIVLCVPLLLSVPLFH
mgnify:CR=1 FL=1